MTSGWSRGFLWSGMVWLGDTCPLQSDKSCRCTFRMTQGFFIHVPTWEVGVIWLSRGLLWEPQWRAFSMPTMAWMAREMKVLASPKEGVVNMELCPLWSSCLGCAYVPVEAVEHAYIVWGHAVFHLFPSLFWGFTLCIWGTLSGTRTKRVVCTPPGSAMGVWAPVGWPAQVARERNISRWITLAWMAGIQPGSPWLAGSTVYHPLFLKAPCNWLPEDLLIVMLPFDSLSSRGQACSRLVLLDLNL